MTGVVSTALDFASAWKAKLQRARLARRWEKLRAMGMHIGQGVNLPASTWIDTSNCYAISIGDWCGFGEQCLILAHDAQMDEFLDAGLVAKVIVHESCHFGSRTVILPGVEVGPRTIVGPNLSSPSPCRQRQSAPEYPPKSCAPWMISRAPSRRLSLRA